MLQPTLLKNNSVHEFLEQIKDKSDKAMNYFLAGFFIVGLLLAPFYDTWMVAIGIGGLALLAYYSSKIALPDSDLYQYVLSIVFAVFMAQYIYQMHGLFEMHFVAFIGSAMLITYQNWKLQLPLTFVVVVHHAAFAYLQYVGYDKIYFTQVDYMSLQTFIIHVFLAAVIFFTCGLWAYQFKKFSEKYIEQSFEIGKLEEDQHQKEALRQSEANMRTIFENTAVGFLLLDIDNNVVAANEMINQWAIQSFGTILTKGMKVREILVPEKQNEFDGLKGVIMAGGQINYETEYPNLDGTLEWHHVTANPVLDENKKVIGICFALNNITLRKKAEAEITELNESLEKKVKERTAELEVSMNELESFSYSVSHDLRAPLRIINGYGKMMLNKYAAQLDEEGKDSLQEIMGNAHRMGNLIDDLLDFSRLGRAPITKQKINMTNMVRQVAEEIKSAGNSAAEIHLQEFDDTDCDPILLKQVWTNIISNAVKYSRKKEKPVIEIGSTGNNGHQTYYVKDNGAGFDMQHADKLFKVFQRLHKVHEYEGTGVGLALVQRIIAKHGGKIWADAKINEGATFYFTLSS